MCNPDFSGYSHSGDTIFNGIRCQNWTKQNNPNFQYLTFLDEQKNWIPLYLYSPKIQILFSQVYIRKQSDAIFNPPKKCFHEQEFSSSPFFSLPDCILFS